MRLSSGESKHSFDFLPELEIFEIFHYDLASRVELISPLLRFL
jgi:hypothetical protein